MKILSSLILICYSLSVIASPVIKPKFKEVMLEEFTQLELSIMPYTATQLVFPFLLDNPLLTPELKVMLSNKDGFKVPTSEGDLRAEITGQNTLTIFGMVPEGGEMPKLMGNLFISIGAYNISIVLKTSYDVRDHISNIVFKQSPDDREHLLERMVERKTKQLEDDYQKKLKELEGGRGNLPVVAAMSLASIDRTSIKQRLKTNINGRKITVDIHDFTIIGGKYGVLKFRAKGVDLITGVSVYQEPEKGVEVLVDGDFSCEDICTFATQDLGLLKHKKIIVSITTPNGEGVVKW